MAGPAVAMILVDFGATVVHIDPPGGPLWKSPANATLNRNKLSISLDLKSTQELEHALALIEVTDIVIESFRPGVMSRLDIDFTELRQARPELITISIPGFASNGELRREWRAYEGVIVANSSVVTDMGLNRVLMGINPSFSPLPLSSAYCTMLAASATVLALQAHERTGPDDQIEVPLAAAVMEGLCYNSIKVGNYPERNHRHHDAFWWIHGDTRRTCSCGYYRCHVWIWWSAGRGNRAEDWVERSQGADIAAAICEYIDTIRTYNSRPAEKYGASTRSILREIGYDNERIDDLLANGTVSESWSREYLPS